MSQPSGKTTVLYGVGDIAPYREDLPSIFDTTRTFLNRGDVVFGQLETTFSNRGTRLPQARHTAKVPPSAARAVREAGFDVISFAGNHCMDWGREAFFDTIESLRGEGVSVIGVGENIQEARQPAIFDVNGSRLAFLAYNSILPMAYWAEDDRPGCVPLRGLTVYEPIEHDQPGTPCRIHTFPHRADLDAMVDDIRKARAQADVVVLSMHWGIHFVPAVLADYQRIIAHTAIDNGADLILGHHAHILKGIEVYKGKAIFYSLCNFAIDVPLSPGHTESRGFKEISKLNPEWKLDPEYPTYFMPPDSRKTLIAKAVIGGKAIHQVSFLPVMINKQSQPEILSSEDPRFSEVTEYVDAITVDQGLGTEFRRADDEVLILGV